MEKPKTKKEIVKMLLNQATEEKDYDDLVDILIDNPISIDVDRQEEANLTLGEKVADKISAIAGSWTFIICFIAFLAFWIVLNSVLLINNKIDPYPFILLNLVLSCVAAIQAPIIMMSQNRQSKKDTLRNKNDYRTDLKSELILEDLHRDIQVLIKNQNKIIKYIEEKK